MTGILRDLGLTGQCSGPGVDGPCDRCKAGSVACKFVPIKHSAETEAEGSRSHPSPSEQASSSRIDPNARPASGHEIQTPSSPDTSLDPHSTDTYYLTTPNLFDHIDLAALGPRDRESIAELYGLVLYGIVLNGKELC